jgi:hypothetical protein
MRPSGLVLLGFFAGLVVVVAALFAPASVRADDSHATRAQAARSDHASLGRVAFEAGAYREALDHFQRAYEATGAPILLYNIGQAADRMRLDATTLRAFQLYLQRYPDAPNRDEVRHRMDALEPLVDIQAKALAAERLKPNDKNHMTVNVAEMLMPSPYGAPSAKNEPLRDAAKPDSHPKDGNVLRSGVFWSVVAAVTVLSVIVIAAAVSAN